jgi:hypothetical protein
MAIGTAAAIGIGLAGVGSALGGAANRSASRQAAQVSQQATDQSIGLQRESRDMALQRLDPFAARGNAAGNQINALLGLGGNQQQFTGAQRNPYTQNASSFWGLGDTPGMDYNGGQSGVNWGAYVQGNPDAMANWDSIRNTSDGQQFGGDVNAFGAYHFNKDGARRDLSPFTAGGGQQQGQTSQQAAEGAFDQFRNSTGYQFRLNEGMNALNSGFAGNGVLRSGARDRSAMQLNQNMASGEFANYFNMLSNQQGVGAGAASASAGVGQNFANNAGNLMMGNADNQANAAIARAQNNPFANFAGTIGGGLIGYGSRR